MTHLTPIYAAARALQEAINAYEDAGFWPYAVNVTRHSISVQGRPAPYTAADHADDAPAPTYHTTDPEPGIRLITEIRAVPACRVCGADLDHDDDDVAGSATECGRCWLNLGSAIRSIPSPDPAPCTICGRPAATEREHRDDCPRWIA